MIWKVNTKKIGTNIPNILQIITEFIHKCGGTETNHKASKYLWQQFTFIPYIHWNKFLIHTEHIKWMTVFQNVYFQGGNKWMKSQFQTTMHSSDLKIIVAFHLEFGTSLCRYQQTFAIEVKCAHVGFVGYLKIQISYAAFTSFRPTCYNFVWNPMISVLGADRLRKY